MKLKSVPSVCVCLLQRITSIEIHNRPAVFILLATTYSIISKMIYLCNMSDDKGHILIYFCKVHFNYYSIYRQFVIYVSRM